MSDVAQHQLVQAIDGVAPSSWDRIVSEPEAVVFALTTPSSAPWPATVSIVAVPDDDWPSADAFAADPEAGAVRLARETSAGQAVAHIDIQVDGALLGCPLSVDIWLDMTPRLRLAATAAGSDLYELGHFLDAITELASTFAPGAKERRPTPESLAG